MNEYKNDKAEEFVYEVNKVGDQELSEEKKEKIKELIDETMQVRKATCPWVEDIIRLQEQMKELPVIRKMLWSLIAGMFLTFITVVITLAVAANNMGSF